MDISIIILVNIIACSFLVYVIFEIISNAFKKKKESKLLEQKRIQKIDELENFFNLHTNELIIALHNLCKLCPYIYEINKYILDQIFTQKDINKILKITQTTYFSNYKACKWRKENQTLFESIHHNYNELKELNIHIANEDTTDFKLLVLLFNFTSNNYYAYYLFSRFFTFVLIDKLNYNNYFLLEELDKTEKIFNNIGGIALDNQQREAILTDEDNSLVIAGAGCGKSTTVIGKITYLTTILNVNPKDILIISFTDKSAKDLTSKVQDLGVIPRTFHKFGKDVIESITKQKISLYDQNTLYFLEKAFNTLIISDTNYLNKVVDYFTNFHKLAKDSFDFKTQNEHIEFLKDQNYRPFKEIQYHSKNKTTYLREIVKSQEECKIANFLLFNSIDYRYEEPYPISTKDSNYRQYNPDFTLYQNGKIIYLEHYGIDRNSNVPPFFANENCTLEQAKRNYNYSIAWKRSLHKQNNTICLETFSYQFQEQTIFEDLKKQLIKNNFVINPLLF
ncbi:AAA family ATPase [Myroides odoratimimus]|uniref:UvrD-helicase domain-containing protein n=1 Tax=Myroides odoratimimus TaxID=76832 RepID=UPI0026DFFDC2|nr:UvrD-helicase domain-containing protein [Myroides odoratimimus]MDO5858598.1 AAA family ATPase [Myroides odoratimimus]